MAAKRAQEEFKMEFTRLYRSETNRVLGGVCGGLGEYFNIDPTLIRLLFAILFVFGGSGLLLYFILWLIIPSKRQMGHLSEETIRANAEDLKERAQSFADEVRAGNYDHSRSLWGLLLIILGVAFLFSNFHIFSFFDFGRFWPVLIIVLGLVILTRRH